jgi:hypothetical protein
MPMLAYLDALLAALAARDISEIDRLLAHPLAKILSPDARADAAAERRAAAAGSPAVSPLRLLQLRHRTAQLLGEHAAHSAAEPAPHAENRRPVPQPSPAPAWPDRRTAARYQMELPLSA